MSDSYDDYEAKIQLAEHAWEQALEEKQEPVYAFRRKGLDDFCTCDKRRYDELSGKPNLFEVTVFYTAPPKAAEWVGLTDEELAEIDGVVMKYIGAGEYVIDGEYEFARAIETKLREKNT